MQVPANHDQASHLVAEQVAAEEPFRSRLQVYLHVLSGAGAVVDWVKGTLLTDYRQRLPDGVHDDFVRR